MDKETRETHPSYGCIQVSRVSGHTALFGSSILHNSFVAITIHKAEMIRDSSYSRLFPRETLIEIHMSHTQFGEFISSMNQGVGVAATLNWFGGERIPQPPFENKVALFRKEFKQDVEKLVKYSAEDEAAIKAILAKPSIGKADREKLLACYKNTSERVMGNLPFINEMFSEQMEKTTQEAKGEVESFVANKLMTIGMDKVKDNFLQLEEGKTEEIKGV